MIWVEKTYQKPYSRVKYSPNSIFFLLDVAHRLETAGLDYMPPGKQSFTNPASMSSTTKA